MTLPVDVRTSQIEAVMSARRNRFQDFALRSQRTKLGVGRQALSKLVLDSEKKFAEVEQKSAHRDNKYHHNALFLMFGSDLRPCAPHNTVSVDLAITTQDQRLAAHHGFMIGDCAAQITLGKREYFWNTFCSENPGSTEIKVSIVDLDDETGG